MKVSKYWKVVKIPKISIEMKNRKTFYKQRAALRKSGSRSSWASGIGTVQMFFLTPNRNMFAGKFMCLESFLDTFWEHIVFNVKRVEIRKMSEVFWPKLYCKLSDLSRLFLLALRLSARKSGIKKTLMMPTGTCGPKLHTRN